MANALQGNAPRVDWDPEPIKKSLKCASNTSLKAAGPFVGAGAGIVAGILGVPPPWATAIGVSSVTLLNDSAGCASDTLLNSAFKTQNACGSKIAIKSGY